MFAEFDSLPETSRVWIYQATRKLDDVEIRAISQLLQAFTQQWAAHGQPLKSSFKIFYHQFIVLAADEGFNEASGCSIDDSVHIVKEIDQKFRLNLFDRTDIAFLKDEHVVIVKLNDLTKTLSAGMWNQDTLYFNNVITNKGALQLNWLVPAGHSWLKRYLTRIAV